MENQTYTTQRWDMTFSKMDIINNTTKAWATGYPESSMDNQTNTTVVLNNAIPAGFVNFVKGLQTLQSGFGPAILVLGIVCNVLTIVTMSDTLFKQLNTQIMLITLAVTDAVLLFVGIFNQFISLEIFGRDVRALSLAGCKSFVVIYRTGKVFSSWIVVYIAFERFLAVMFPLHVKALVNRKTTIITLTCMLLGVIGFNLAWSFSSAIVNRTCVPSYRRPEIQDMHKVFNIIRGIQFSFLPILILLAVTPPIIYKIISSHRRRGDMVANPTGSTKDLTRTTLMLITVVLLHIVSSLPLTMYFIQEVVYDESVFGHLRPEYAIIYRLQPTMEGINHASNFLIYVLFSRPFRQRLVEKIRCNCLMYFVHLRLIEQRRETSASTHSSGLQ